MSASIYIPDGLMSRVMPLTFPSFTEYVARSRFSFLKFFIDAPMNCLQIHISRRLACDHRPFDSGHILDFALKTVMEQIY